MCPHFVPTESSYPLDRSAQLLIPQIFLQHKAEVLQLLTRGSHIYEYMDKNIFDPR